MGGVRCGLLILLLGLTTFPVVADVNEFELKVAFLYRFAQFVDWPQDLLEPQEREFVLCCLEEELFSAASTTLRGKLAHGHPLRVRRSMELQECQIVFFDRLSLREALGIKEPQPRLLTVSDELGFAAKGGMIEMIRVENRSQFEINLKAAKAAGPGLSSMLLRLATKAYQ